MNTLDSALSFQEHALKLAGQQQQLIASNIANSDTPGYRAQQMDFAKALERAQQASASPAASTGGVLAKTNSRHLGASVTDAGPGNVTYSNPSQPSIDGNTVDMDHERTQFAESTVRTQAAFTFLNGQVKEILAAIQG